MSGGPGVVVAGRATASELRPDVVLMDFRMPDLDGTDATRAILQRRPTTRVVAFTVLSSDDAVAVAFRSLRLLGEGLAIDDVATAVRAAAAGSGWLSPRAAESCSGRCVNPIQVGSPILGWSTSFLLASSTWFADRPGTYAEAPRDLGVPKPLSNQSQHVELARESWSTSPGSGSRLVSD